MQAFREILHECGQMLLSLPQEKKVEGVWIGDQFKARADQLAHQLIANRLSESFPSIPIVSEEDHFSFSKFPNNSYFLIDPIDGTASFSQGFSGWVTQIALVENEKPTICGIYAPAFDTFFSAIVGDGAYCNDQLLPKLEGYIVSSIIDNYPEPNVLVQKLMTSFGIERYLESGSISLKICRIADGSADLFCKSMFPRDWDLAAPMVVLSEVNGVITDINGSEIKIGTNIRRNNGLIAAKSPQIVAKVVDFFNATG